MLPSQPCIKDRRSMRWWFKQTRNFVTGPHKWAGGVGWEEERYDVGLLGAWNQGSLGISVPLDNGSVVLLQQDLS